MNSVSVVEAASQCLYDILRTSTASSVLVKLESVGSDALHWCSYLEPFKSAQPKVIRPLYPVVLAMCCTMFSGTDQQWCCMAFHRHSRLSARCPSLVEPLVHWSAEGECEEEASISLFEELTHPL